MLLMKLGYRNLWRNRRRTLLTMIAMGVATAMVILMLGIYDGMIWDMIDSATVSYHGHVKITAEGYLEKRKMVQTIEQDGLHASISADPRVAGIAGRTRGFALLSFGEGDASHTQPAELLGIDPAEERAVTTLEDQVATGSFITGPDSHDIVLGAGLARRLEAEIGGEIVAMGQGADGSIAAEIFTVSGIIESGDPLRDASLAITGRTTVQRMFVLEGQLHEWAVLLNRPLAAREWATELQAGLDGIDVQSWLEFLPQMGQMMDMWGAMKFVFALIFYFAVILVAVNTMYMAFFERMREFGVMEALGLKVYKLSGLIMFEGILMSAISGIVGGLIGIGLSYYMSVHHIDLSGVFEPISYAGGALQPRIKSYPALDNMLYPILMIIGLGMIVAIFPALKLRRLRPVDVLKEV